ncbi:type II toxin-antitoxin system RelE/ParE family toxin [Methylosarcina fibrata]|uniref:type II toxin-antitoxin system RelE/ParE family toxin n=1 Tax=Methylosarcina fibrata TaxID=105972 RepID=UPI00035D0398|nr:type II toxin-antitoxin system mRNA interferase toxin, RelE/StbE family [Methylosarcina fibrata]
MKIVWTEPARQDLRQIFIYIAKDSPKSAAKVLSLIKERTVLLQDNPLLGRMGRVDGTRELVITGSPYILPYRLKENQIQILAVFHSARRWPEHFN